jgi:ribosomal protein S27E
MDLKGHVWRPLFVVIVLVAFVVFVKQFIVPKGFGVIDKDVGYMYGYGRKGNIGEWKAYTAKFKFNNEYCKDCHSKNYEEMMANPHAIIKCEDCHGPVLDHPSDPPKLTIEKGKVECLRCHFLLPYPGSGRANIRGVDPAIHNPDIECTMCHNPHKPKMEGM